MAQHLTRTVGCGILYLLLTAQGNAAAGDTPRDPTLPPASLNAAPETVNSSAAPIQLITISGQHRSAVVRGTTVKVGDRISEGRISRITDNSIWVKGDDGTSVLKLFPDVDKHLHASTTQPATHRIQR